MWLSLTLAKGISGLELICTKWGIAKSDATNSAVCQGFSLDARIMGSTITANNIPLANCRIIKPGETINVLYV